MRARTEVVICVVLYVLYSLTRSALDGDISSAQRNAYRLIDLESSLGIFHEASIQRWFDHAWLMVAFNTFYGAAHFAVTGGVLVWLFRRRVTGAFGYRFWRNTIVGTTLLALVGYATFPLMPPRLLPGDMFFDALERYGGLWSYSSGVASAISNQYAAMPSLHAGWALWCTLAVVAARPARWITAAAVGYSLLVILAVVVTGNHYFLDVVGGYVVLGCGLAIAYGLLRLHGEWGRRRAQR